MFQRLYKIFDSLHDQQIDGRGLAIFRIAFSLVLLAEVLQLFYFRHLIFDEVPYLISSEIEMWPVLIFWVMAILFVIFGLFTRIAALVNYILSVVVIGTISSFGYHMFYSYLVISFLFIFLPVSKVYSLDRLLLKLKYSHLRIAYQPPQTVSVLSYYIPVVLGLGFVYFDSIFYKYNSHLWIHGLGLWLPSSVPQAVFIDITPILNLKHFVLFLGYLTLIFETIFLFVFWRKKWRIPVLIVGIGLHMGILVCFPIPLFALGFAGIYLLLVPVGCWRRLFKSNPAAKQRVKFYDDGECAICNRSRIILSHFDTRNRVEFLSVQGHAQQEPKLKSINNDQILTHVYAVDNKGKVYAGLAAYLKVLNLIWYLKPFSWLLRIPGLHQLAHKIYEHTVVNRLTERCSENNYGYTVPVLPSEKGEFKILNNFTLKNLKVNLLLAGLAVFVLFQFFVTYNSPLLKKVRDHMGVSEYKIIQYSEHVSGEIAKITKIYFGITHHGVFVDSHFIGNNYSIAVLYRAPSGEKEWLPITSEKGTPGNYLVGPIWTKWTFRVNNPIIEQERFLKGLRNFTAFWAHQHNISLHAAVFEIKVKKYLIPEKWEYDFLKRQLQQNWVDAGEVEWKDHVFSADVKLIEQM